MRILRGMLMMMMNPLVLCLCLLVLNLKCGYCLVAVVDTVESSEQFTCSSKDEAIASAYLLQQRHEQEDLQQRQHSSSISTTIGHVGSYHLHGWRWHGMAVLREIKMLQRVLQQPPQDEYHDDDDETMKLQQSVVPSRRTSCDVTSGVSSLARYSIGFNMKGLHHVESNLFFPWLKMQLFHRIQDPTSRDAFQRILQTMMEYQEELSQQGQFVVRLLCASILQGVYVIYHIVCMSSSVATRFLYSHF